MAMRVLDEINRPLTAERAEFAENFYFLFLSFFFSLRAHFVSARSAVKKLFAVKSIGEMTCPLALVYS
jgi:hypothetical protein